LFSLTKTRPSSFEVLPHRLKQNKHKGKDGARDKDTAAMTQRKLHKDIFIAAARGSIESIQEFLKLGISINVKNQRPGAEGRSSLHAACYRSQNHVVDFLLEKGADVNIVDDNNETCLILSTRRADASLVTLLLSYGATQNGKNSSGLTAKDYTDPNKNPSRAKWERYACKFKKIATLLRRRPPVRPSPKYSHSFSNCINIRGREGRRRAKTDPQSTRSPMLTNNTSHSRKETSRSVSPRRSRPYASKPCRSRSPTKSSTSKSPTSKSPSKSPSRSPSKSPSKSPSIRSPSKSPSSLIHDLPSVPGQLISQKRNKLKNDNTSSSKSIASLETIIRSPIQSLTASSGHHLMCDSVDGKDKNEENIDDDKLPSLFPTFHIDNKYSKTSDTIINHKENIKRDQVKEDGKRSYLSKTTIPKKSLSISIVNGNDVLPPTLDTKETAAVTSTPSCNKNGREEDIRDKEEDCNMKELVQWLSQLSLNKYLPILIDLGVKKLKDLTLIDITDFNNSVGSSNKISSLSSMKLIERRKFILAASKLKTPKRMIEKANNMKKIDDNCNNNKATSRSTSTSTSVSKTTSTTATSAAATLTAATATRATSTTVMTPQPTTRATFVRNSNIIETKKSHSQLTSPPPRAPPKSNQSKIFQIPPRAPQSPHSTNVLLSTNARGLMKAKVNSNTFNDKKIHLNQKECYKDGSYCVIIALNDYESANVPINNGGMPNLLCARNDGSLIKDLLINQHQFEVIGELYDSNATSINFLNLLDNVKNKLNNKKLSRFIFFLASHGHLDDDERGWICTHGCNLQKLNSTCIKMSMLKDFAESIDCQHQLYLLDCCHAGSLLVTSRGHPSTSQYVKAMLESPAIHGLTAVTKNQEALEEGGHGMFTRSFVEGLNGGVGVFARGERNFVTTTELFSYVRLNIFFFFGTNPNMGIILLFEMFFLN
jgi:hypothetical protein